MSISIYNLHLDDKVISLGFEEIKHESKPYVQLGDHRYKNLDDVIQSIPDLSKANQVDVLAKVVNFFFYGLDFTVIENPKEFREKYEKQFSKDANLRAFGKFNVSIVKSPVVEKPNLVFFVVERTTGIPYKVTCSSPFNSQKITSYERLEDIG